MTLSERVESDYIKAYKEKNQTALAVLRLLKTAAKNRLVELRMPGKSLDDGEMTDVILKQAKQRRDSIEQYQLAGRNDLADREKAELDVLNSYLPEKMSDEELRAAVEDAVREAGASSPRDLGRVMKLLMEKCKGAADGKKLSEMARARLTG